MPILWWVPRPLPHDLLSSCDVPFNMPISFTMKVLKSKGIFGAIEGGYDLEFRKKSAEIISTKDVDGYIINGLHNNGPEVETIDFNEVRPVIKEVLVRL